MVYAYTFTNICDVLRDELYSSNGSNSILRFSERGKSSTTVAMLKYTQRPRSSETYHEQACKHALENN